MIRERLHRGKRVDNGKWVEGFYWKDIWGDNTEYIMYDGEDYEVIPETVGDCTGVPDKNGKWIFEDDIIRYSIYPPTEYEYGVVNFHNGGFRAGTDSCNLCVCSADGAERYKLEVIGNIHDNPELLEVAE